MLSIRKLATMMATAGSLLVLTASSAFAFEGGVKVECNGVCGLVNLGQVCDAVSWNSTPVAVACDDTSSAINSGSVWCGSGFCIHYGSYSRGDTVAAYCNDGGGYDAVVTCRY